MPIYEYQCQSCGERREVLQRMSDAPLKTCDECGGEVRKLISAPAFQFKGSGWYVTDYARKGDPGEGGTAEKPATNGDSAGDKSTESKSAGSESKTSGSSTAESGSAKSATASA